MNGTNLCNKCFCTMPVDGGWGTWQPWSECSVVCDVGTRDRNRSCDNPVPQHGGASCVGVGSEDDDCNTHPCPGNTAVFHMVKATCSLARDLYFKYRLNLSMSIHQYSGDGGYTI